MAVIGIDFDGTLIEQEEYPSTRMKPLPYAISSLKKLAKMGHKLILCSARYGWYRQLARGFIMAHNLPIEVPKSRIKPSCDIYIDDRNFGCENINWKEIVAEIERRTYVQSNKKT